MSAVRLFFKAVFIPSEFTDIRTAASGISRYLASGIDGRGKPRRKTDHGYCPEARQMQCAGDRAALRRNRRECRATAKGDNRPCRRRAFALLRLAERTRQQILDLISDHGTDPGRTFPAGFFFGSFADFFDERQNRAGLFAPVLADVAAQTNKRDRQQPRPAENISGKNGRDDNPDQDIRHLLSFFCFTDDNIQRFSVFSSGNYSLISRNGIGKLLIHD